MIALSLVGIGTGNPDHLTRQGEAALNAADLILIPRKRGDKADLAELRQALCAAVVTNPGTRVVAFDMPQRDSADPDYLGGVHRWHDAIAAVWHAHIAKHLPAGGRLALLVWGDPSLYDSTLRIADRLARRLPLRVSVVPGITALQALTAAHAIPLNELNAPVIITTGRRLREHGWPDGVDTLAVMLDGDCAFATLDPAGISIWWGAYLGMPGQLCIAGPLAEVGAQIIQQRAAARAAHGWIMDTYLLRRGG
ncbi:precorrin-6A synthase (deacetylating) [Rhodoferax koreense]|uniref:Precorrin-6A synthase (Deacetylating) n=1 Tax=Rhodoferax koreensis TaxID=1842727 RepID=A0A1P8JS33_9BURK|nr:precorrin-6A synthase (deacetylating) [Rhodoferax koreense]APW36573.1 precorrin-6A synthase (deacetylating) [Rhodoferax koreense]